MIRAMLLPLVVTLSLVVCEAGRAQATRHPGAMRIGGFSTQVSPQQARAGSQITVGAGGVSVDVSLRAKSRAWTKSGGKSGTVPTLPVGSLPSAGSGSVTVGATPSWWRPRGYCFAPVVPADCYTVTPGGARSVVASVRVAPAVAASTVADGMTLELSGIEASPSASRAGLTGAASWFWLDSAPVRVQRSITLGAETVTVTADPSQISWDFGDGSSEAGGPGVPYGSDATAAAITHVYETRCLPGDQGNDPYVLASCVSDGYHVTATTTWAISFTSTGPVTGSGDLPARTTESTLVYPVSEVRAFLDGGSP